MSEPCIYCGGCVMQAVIVRDALGYPAHPACAENESLERLEAEYAALAAAHDAAMAEMGRRLANALTVIRSRQTSNDVAATYMRHQRDAALARADAAEAQLARAREDGARSAFAWMAPDLIPMVPTPLDTSLATLCQKYTETLLAAWRAAQTEQTP